MFIEKINFIQDESSFDSKNCTTFGYAKNEKKFSVELKPQSASLSKITVSTKEKFIG